MCGVVIEILSYNQKNITKSCYLFNLTQISGSEPALVKEIFQEISKDILGGTLCGAGGGGFLVALVKVRFKKPVSFFFKS